MPNPTGPDREDTANPSDADRDAESGAAESHDAGDDQATDVYPVVSADTDAATEAFPTGSPAAPETEQQQPERRYTAPGFDAGQTEIIRTAPGAPTEAFEGTGSRRGSKAAPQLIPPRLARKLSAPVSRSWGWVLALVLIILALAVIAVLGTVWLTRDSRARASQEERVRGSIENYDVAVQKGDLATLRGLTCGSERDNYLNYTDQLWDDTYRRVAAAKQYPVVASIDEVVVNGDHAEANVTAFMAYAPQIRSTRSIDLQYRDDQWKICQSRTD